MTTRVGDNRKNGVNYVVVTCEIKLFQNYFSIRRRPSEIILPEIISQAYCSLM